MKSVQNGRGGGEGVCRESRCMFIVLLFIGASWRSASERNLTKRGLF